jgi:hypothetical protein
MNKCQTCGEPFAPRKHNTGKFCSVACYNDWRKGKVTNSGQFVKGSNVGSSNVNWAGDNAKYGTVHDYITYHFGQPQICEHCDIKNLGSRKHQWANISGKYKRDRSDWLRLCAKCHFKYDGRNKHLEKYQKMPIRKKCRANKTGFKNVRLTRSGTYRPHLRIDGKTKYLGTYASPQEAYQVYKEKALELYGTY